MKRIFLVDDHPMIREGLGALIERQDDMTVCGSAEQAEGALAKIRAQRADLAIVDINLPGANGLELVRELRPALPQLKILILSMHCEQVYCGRALAAGANGYVTKKEPPQGVLSAIREIFSGKISISPKMAKSLGIRQSRSGELPEINALSNRELEVFLLIGEGTGTAAIAERLGISVKTVETYRAKIKEKFRIKSATQLIKAAVEMVRKW